MGNAGAGHQVVVVVEVMDHPGSTGSGHLDGVTAGSNSRCSIWWNGATHDGLDHTGSGGGGWCW